MVPSTPYQHVSEVFYQNDQTDPGNFHYPFDPLSHDALPNVTRNLNFEAKSRSSGFGFETQLPGVQYRNMARRRDEDSTDSESDTLNIDLERSTSPRPEGYECGECKAVCRTRGSLRSVALFVWGLFIV